MKITTDQIHPEIRQQGEQFRQGLPYFSMDIIKQMNAARNDVVPDNRRLNVQTVYLTRNDASKLRILIYSEKKSTASTVPGILWFHGGGYAMGQPEDEIAMIEQLVHASRGIIFAPDYTLSLQAPYPAALNDAYLSLLWLKDNINKYNLRSNQIVVGGCSSGGGLAAALSLYARDKGEVNIALQLPIYPMLDDRMITESMKDNDAPVWGERSNKNAWDIYLGNQFDSANVPIYAAPNRAEDLSNMPPAISFVGTIDPFYDETVQYFTKLKKAGIWTNLLEVKGAFHCFDIAAPESQLTKSAFKFLSTNLRFALDNFFAEQN
ncbi:alpha/beta hydrolase [Companilactobacillus furfuricola]|uniref:alpha/beta hydrolase n=1 Tax=Companilactobacillus furfuricola TaxID=1462575 RepID=UPI001B86E356|nr:alpha/beta hydrolase [Companilactobacillus furfuricola]